MKPPSLYKLILCVQHIPTYKLFNHHNVPMRSLNFLLRFQLHYFLPLLSAILPLNPFLHRVLLGVNDSNAQYYAFVPYHIIPCVCLNRILSCVQLSFLMSTLNYKSFSSSSSLCLSLAFTFTSSCVHDHLPILEHSSTIPLCVLELIPKVIHLTFSLHLNYFS